MNAGTRVTERYVKAGSFRTRYLEAGPADADVLLLLHDGAWGASSSVTWGAMIARFADRYRVLAPDLLGYGGTDKAVFLDRSPHSFRIAHLADFLRAVGVTSPVHAVGNSFGGAVALRAIAAEESFPLRSVTSIAGSGGPWRTPLAHDLGRWDGTREDLARVVAYLVDDFPGLESHISERLRWASEPGHVKSVKAPNTKVPGPVRTSVDDPWPQQLEGTEVPILLVRCARDILLEPQWADNLRAAVPEATIVLIDDKHSPNIDRPDELYPILQGFLTKVGSRKR
ncbi:alpha/beta hydrolase [Arthrobacter sp. NPDC080073]|uniref:alpha/beta fold hydrolase n=1 Tax=Arthrobacter sp. NPDC080073 TaxID=3155919 RepID=UPI0034411434